MAGKKRFKDIHTISDINKLAARQKRFEEQFSTNLINDLMGKYIMKTKIDYSYAYLIIGFVFLFFFNGRWILPIAAFMAPIFLIRFLRYQKPFIGFLFIEVIPKGRSPQSASGKQDYAYLQY